MVESGRSFRDVTGNGWSLEVVKMQKTDIVTSCKRKREMENGPESAIYLSPDLFPLHLFFWCISLKCPANECESALGRGREMLEIRKYTKVIM